MATFPSLRPSVRSFSPGEYANTAYQTIDGKENRVRHSNVFLDSSLQITFNAISESQLLSILSHYQGQYGRYQSFDLPADIWSGLDTISDFSPTAYRWCYAQSPRVEDLPSGNHTVQITLITVPPEGASLNGFSGIILHSFVPGAVLVSNGITTTIAVSFAPGLGDAPVNASGATLSITATIADNGATGGAAVVGANLAITCSLSYAPPATVDVDRFELLGLIEDDLQNLGF